MKPEVPVHGEGPGDLVDVPPLAPFEVEVVGGGVAEEENENPPSAKPKSTTKDNWRSRRNPNRWRIPTIYYRGAGGGPSLPGGTVVYPTQLQLQLYSMMGTLGEGGTGAVEEMSTRPSCSPPRTGCAAWIVIDRQIVGSLGTYEGQLAEVAPPGAPPFESCFDYVGADLGWHIFRMKGGALYYRRRLDVGF